ncbi:helix-turn-helix transcriptional regulator [Bacillaceae bacterium Marseille-Q3522]|nr:helix-turn-helix transcriptional regulator [Bacillaceae bacterium Marseille-Q3522]
MGSFGERLKTLRNSKKLKQEELAKKMNISKSAIGMYERNEREPSFEIIEKFAEFFNVSLDFLLTGKEKKEESTGNLFFFDMEGLTDEEIEDIKRHIEYVKWKAEQERKK